MENAPDAAGSAAAALDAYKYYMDWPKMRFASGIFAGVVIAVGCFQVYCRNWKRFRASSSPLLAAGKVALERAEVALQDEDWICAVRHVMSVIYGVVRSIDVPREIPAADTSTNVSDSETHEQLLVPSYFLLAHALKTGKRDKRSVNAAYRAVLAHVPEKSELELEILNQINRSEENNSDEDDSRGSGEEWRTCKEVYGQHSAVVYEYSLASCPLNSNTSDAEGHRKPSVCSHCIGVLPVDKPEYCRCCGEIYCSSSCAAQAWVLYHRWLCNLPDRIVSDPLLVLFSRLICLMLSSPENGDVIEEILLDSVDNEVGENVPLLSSDMSLELTMEYIDAIVSILNPVAPGISVFLTQECMRQCISHLQRSALPVIYDHRIQGWAIYHKFRKLNRSVNYGNVVLSHPSWNEHVSLTSVGPLSPGDDLSLSVSVPIAREANSI